LVKQRRESADVYRNAGREELAIREESELSVLKTYLPEMMSEDEVSKLVEAVIQETEAAGMADIGKVMPLVIQRGGGKLDGKTANTIVRKLLQ